MNRKTPSDTALLYRSLEEQASLHPVRAIRLTGKKHGPFGLLLVDDTIPGPEVASALAGLRLADQSPTPPCGRTDEELPDKAWLRQQLTVELGRVQQTRLPSALLLITFSGHNTESGSSTLTKQAATTLTPCLHQGDVFSGFQKNGLALIMPGATVGKARKRAEEIRSILRHAAFSKNVKLAMGIAVCHAYETIAPDQLLALAEAELSRAAETGSDAICQSAAARSEDSCQVTVEERAQLWMQPRKASRAAGIAA